MGIGLLELLQALPPISLAPYPYDFKPDPQNHTRTELDQIQGSTADKMVRRIATGRMRYWLS